MIFVEPVGTVEPLSERREPPQYQLPVVVPPLPAIPHYITQPEKQNSPFWYLVAMGGIIAAVGSTGSPGNLGAARLKQQKGERTTSASIYPGKRPGNKLLYMWLPPGEGFDKAISVPKSKLTAYKKKAIQERTRAPQGTSGKKSAGRLYYIWTESAGMARMLLTKDPTTRHKWTGDDDPIKGVKSSAEQMALFGDGCRDEHRIIRQTAEHHEAAQALSGALSGRVLNCAIWVPDGKGGYDCGGYARTCDPQPSCEEPPDPTKKQAKVCVKTQKVYSAFLDKDIPRCKRYNAACSGPACMPEGAMPYPSEPSER